MFAKACRDPRSMDFGEDVPSRAKSAGPFFCLFSGLLFAARACVLLVFPLLILAGAAAALVFTALVLAFARGLGGMLDQICSLFSFAALVAIPTVELVWLLLTGQAESFIRRFIDLIGMLNSWKG